MESLLFDLNNKTDLFDLILESCKQNGLDIKVGDLITENFSDGEVSAFFKTSVRNKRIFILTTPNSSDKIMELMLIIDAAKRASAKEIIPIITYMPYSRTDKKDQARGPIGAKVMAEMIENRGATSIVTLDLHADQIQGFFNIPVLHMEGKYLFDRYIFELYRDHCGDSMVLCAPDAGAAKRVKGFRDQIRNRWDIDVPIVMIDKTRLKANEVDTMVIIGEVKDKDVVIIDDMCDTAGTLCKAAEELKNKGAKSVTAIATHRVLSGLAYSKLHKSILSEFVCSDSLPISEDSKYIDIAVRVISTGRLIGKAIYAIIKDTSVESLKQTYGE